MMSRIFIMIILLFTTDTFLFCQTATFKGQLLQDNVPVRNYTVNVDGKPVTTDDAGIFKLPVSSSVTQVTVVSSDKKYIIVYPSGGKAFIPKDASLITQIIVAVFKSNDYVKSYLSISKQIKDSIGKSQGQLKSLQVQLDSMVKFLHKLKYTDDDLRSAKEIQEGKERNVFDIIKDLQDYSRNARNLVSAFKYISDYAFSNNKAINELSQAVLNYNQTYDRLDGKKVFYQKAINDYWGSEQVKSFKDIVALALDTLHSQKIYPLRDLLKQLNDYFNNNNKNPELKNDIQRKIAVVVAQDADLIEQLENEITQFSQSLIN